MNAEFIVLLCLNACIKLFASSLLFSLLYSVYRPSLSPRHIDSPRHLHIASAFMLSFGSMSIVAPVLSTVLHMLPTLSDVIVFEHCHGQDCGPHQPSAVKLSFLGMLLVTAAATALFIVIIFILRKIVSEISIARRNLQVLTQLASSVKPLASQNTFAPAGNYSVIESKDIFAWCAGFVKPKIFVSRGMLERITKKQLSAVLAHEHCHLQQRDNLRKLILHGCTLFWLPWQQKHIRSDFVLSVERYSDFYAKCYLGGIQHRRRQGFSVDDLIHSVVQSLLLIAWVALMTSASHFLIETH